MEPTLYPLKCKPLLKEKIWGGSELQNFLNKPSQLEKTGESWEVAAIPQGTSAIANGVYKGKKLSEITSAFAKAILGAPVIEKFGGQVPLLIKFIDASDKLSVQLHPDDHLAKTIGGTGKTEMWYVLKAKEGAHIIAGFKEDIDEERLSNILKSNTLEEHLNYIPVKEGDAFYISAGLIHAIGEGVLIAEIQQPSDITYRIHDYNRKQEDGSYRQLHLEEAREAIKFKNIETVKLSYEHSKVGSQVLKHSPYFKTDIIFLNTTEHVIERTDSLTILMVVKGTGVLLCDSKNYELQLGDTYIIPAACSVSSVKGEGIKFLEVYL